MIDYVSKHGKILRNREGTPCPVFLSISTYGFEINKLN